MPVIDGTYFELSGAASGPALVLINSLGSDRRMWEHVLPAFETHHRVLRFDMPGHGLSAARPGLCSLAQLGEIVLTLLDELRLERVDVCGISLGGVVALGLGIHAPGRVRRLVLANTAAVIGTLQGWEQRIAAVEGAGMQELARVTIGRWFTPAYAEHHPEEMTFIRGMIAATDAGSYVACCGVLRDTDLRAELPAVTAPCLVITGAHDGATPPSGGKALAAGLRTSRHVELDCSHLSAWERGAEFATAVHAFLESPEESAAR